MVLKDVEIIDTAYNAGGVGKVDQKGGKRLVIFVPDAVEGDICDIEITEEKGFFWYGKIKNIVKPSPYRATPICKYYSSCGGCSFMHIAYSSQLLIKEKILKNLLRKLSLPKIEIISDKDEYYRLRISLHAEEGKIGFYAPKSHNIIPIDACKIVKQSLFERIKLFAEESKFSGDIYAIENEEGVALAEITPKDNFTSSLEDIITIANKYFAGFIYAGVSYGKKVAEYKVNEELIPFSGNSFFQANRYLLGRLQSSACSLAEEIRFEFKSNKVVELYAGAGFFTELLLKRGFEVEACEVSSSACEMARCQIDNSDSGKYLFNYIKKNSPELILKNKKQKKRDSRQINSSKVQKKSNEIIFMDPPRMGLDKNIVDNILLLKPCGIIYISCNPTTLARDLERLLITQEYVISRSIMVDMYPNTYHIEAVIKLTRI